jgi:hypothetical protein
VLARLQRQITATGDAALVALREELLALAPPAASAAPSSGWRVAPDRAGDGGAFADDAVIIPFVLHTPNGRLAFLSTVTVFGAPHDVTLAELAIETLLPADEATAAALRAAQAAPGSGS